MIHGLHCNIGRGWNYRNISHTLPFSFRLRLDSLEACFSGLPEVENVDVANYLQLLRLFGGTARIKRCGIVT
jgi:hypothetical protein